MCSVLFGVDMSNVHLITINTLLSLSVLILRVISIRYVTSIDVDILVTVDTIDDLTTQRPTN